jgi:hypothetical protein
MLKVLTSQLGDSLKTVSRFLARPINVHAGNVTLGAPVARQQSQAREDQRQRERRMRHDLFRLMEQHPGSRQLMRHLDLVEKTLRRDGFAGVEALPMRVIAKALMQLEGLVWDWTSEGLAELRSRMAVIVKNRPARIASDPAEPQAAREAPVELYPTVPHGPDVTEVDHSDLGMFAEMERSWAGEVPEAISKAVAAAKEPSTA